MSKPMRICCLTRLTLAHQAKGGLEVHVKTLSEELARAGHEVTIVTTAHPEKIEFQETNGAKIYYCRDSQPERYSEAWRRSSLYLLSKLHHENPFDVIWGEHDAAYYYIRHARKKLGIPVVTVLQQSFIGGLRSQLTELRYNKNLALLFVRQFPGVFYRYLTKERIYAGRADAVIAPSEQSARDARWEYMLRGRRVFASVNGVDTDRFRPLEDARRSLRVRIGVSEKTQIVFTASRLVRGKGIDLLIRAFEKLLTEFPNAKLLIAGVGPARPQLVDLVNRTGLSEKITFTGYIQHESLPEYYNACDIFVYPTLLYESFGISVAEAMACARPVVAARSGGISTSIDHGENGFLYEPNRVDQLVKWCALVLRERSLAEDIGRSARKKAEDALSSARMLRDTIEVFRSAVKQNRHRSIC